MPSFLKEGFDFIETYVLILISLFIFPITNNIIDIMAHITEAIKSKLNIIICKNNLEMQQMQIQMEMPEDDHKVMGFAIVEEENENDEIL